MRIFIGIPCYNGVTPEVYQDHLRWVYHLGRRCPQHDFFLGVKSKTEQFRARNAIVRAAIQIDADYLLMVDDDMVFDTLDSSTPCPAYGFIDKLLEHEKDVIGVLYYHRGSDCSPVMMKEERPGKFKFLMDHEITGGLQEVDVAGGGCLLVNMKIFEKMEEPYFAPEFEWGTDIQLCAQAKALGYKVFVDSGIEVGHVMDKRTIVTSKNRHMVFAETQEEGNANKLQADWMTQATINDYILDAVDYLGVDLATILDKATKYRKDHFENFEPTPEYYINLGNDQLCRQIAYHATNGFAREMMEMTLKMMTGKQMTVFDYACGSAPIGFELLRMENDVTFVDLNGAGGFEFLKWRLRKHRLNANVLDSREIVADDLPYYNCILLMDAIEHFEDWQGVLDLCLGQLYDGGAVITNYFMLGDDPENVEHVSMDKTAVKDYFVKNGCYPLNYALWIKNPIGVTEKGGQDGKGSNS